MTGLAGAVNGRENGYAKMGIKISLSKIIGAEKTSKVVVSISHP